MNLTLGSSCEISSYVNGLLHNIYGPASIRWYVNASQKTCIYAVSGNVVTKKAFTALQKQFESGQDLSEYVAKYKFYGSFYSDEFEFHGIEGALVYVRSGGTCYVLNKAARIRGTYTAFINNMVKTFKSSAVEQGLDEKMVEVHEVSMRELEKILVEQIVYVLR